MNKKFRGATAETQHCEKFCNENALPDVRRVQHEFYETPLDDLACTPCSPEFLDTRNNKVFIRRSSATIMTRQSSFEIWTALTNLEFLLSDHRRIAPSYRFEQIAGEPGIVVGNEYRTTLTEPKRLATLNAALKSLSEHNEAKTTIDQRKMDIRVIRAGPWGGETSELVIKPLKNHALAGISSLWVLAHGNEDTDMLITLDSMELARWAWAPDMMAELPPSQFAAPTRIVDWDYLFDRLTQTLDGQVDESIKPIKDEFSVRLTELATDERIRDALRIHTGCFLF